MFLILLGFISVRLFYWQVLSADSLGAMAEKQRLSNLTIPAQRGKILASNGNPMVINKRAYGIYLEPKKVSAKDKLISVLGQELDIPSSTISAALSNDFLTWLPIAHKVDSEKSEKIKNYNLDGITFTKEQKRFYPESSMSAHLLGFVGNNAKGEDQGYFGVEGYYDEQLRGRDGLIVQEQDVAGNPILAGDREAIPAEDGRDITLYLDKTIQFIAQNELKQGIEKYGAKGGSVIIVDPLSGGILAMISYPDYNPGEFSTPQKKITSQASIDNLVMAVRKFDWLSHGEIGREISKEQEEIRLTILSRETKKILKEKLPLMDQQTQPQTPLL